MSEWSEPLLTVTSPFPAGEARPGSPLHVLSPGDEVVTLLVDGRDVLVRLFHAHDEPGECSIALNVEPESVELVELDGTPRERCGVSFDESRAKLVRIAMLALWTQDPAAAGDTRNSWQGLSRAAGAHKGRGAAEPLPCVDAASGRPRRDRLN